MEKEHKILKAEQGHTHPSTRCDSERKWDDNSNSNQLFCSAGFAAQRLPFPLTLSPSLFAFNDVNDGKYRRQVVQVGFARFFWCCVAAYPLCRARVHTHALLRKPKTDYNPGRFFFVLLCYQNESTSKREWGKVKKAVLSSRGRMQNRGLLLFFTAVTKMRGCFIGFWGGYAKTLIPRNPIDSCTCAARHIRGKPPPMLNDESSRLVSGPN